MSILVWVLVGIALWHFTVLLPDRFHGGIIGAFLYAVAGALLTGWAPAGARRAAGQSARARGRRCGRSRARSQRSAFAYWWGARDRSARWGVAPMGAGARRA